jgi:hypothetical protein
MVVMGVMALIGVRMVGDYSTQIDMLVVGLTLRKVVVNERFDGGEQQDKRAQKGPYPTEVSWRIPSNTNRHLSDIVLL